jgi:hypothetical protein
MRLSLRPQGVQRAAGDQTTLEEEQSIAARMW